MVGLSLCFRGVLLTELPSRPEAGSSALIRGFPSTSSLKYLDSAMRVPVSVVPCTVTVRGTVACPDPTLTFCDCVVLQRMLAVQSYAPPAALSSAWSSPPAGPVQLDSREHRAGAAVPALPHCVPRGADAPDAPAPGSARFKSGRSGHCTRQAEGFY